jgi:inner membrane protein involved in colicin E2 resistance
MDQKTLSLLVIIVLLIGIIVVQNIIHKQERQDLYSRIMAKDLRDYRMKKQRTVPNVIRKRTSDELKRQGK